MLEMMILKMLEVGRIVVRVGQDITVLVLHMWLLDKEYIHFHRHH